MKIIASGDHHFDQGSRFDECVRVHSWMSRLVHEERPDVFLSAGDLYERASTPKEREAVAEWLTQIAEVCPVIVTKGNHDRPLDCSILARLRTVHPVIVQEAAGVEYIGEAAIACMAWPDRASIAAALGANGAGQQELDQLSQDALRNVLSGLGSELAEHDGPKILLGHFMVDGSKVSTGQPLVGQSLNIGLTDIALVGADITIMGHIHMPQTFEFEGRPILYTGSPFRTTFGEVEDKSVLIAEWTPEHDYFRWDRIDTPATPMLLFTDEWGFDEGDAGWLVGLHEYEGRESVRGAEIRFRYRVPSDQREAAAAAAQEIKDGLLAQGALTVKVEDEVISTTRARAPEVAKAITLEDKLRAYWKSRGEEIDETRQTALVGKAHEIEEDVRGAA